TGAVGHPVGVVPFPWDRVVRPLGRPRLATALRRQQRREARRGVGMLALEPDRVVPAAEGHVHRQLHVLEAAVRSVGALAPEAVLRPLSAQVHRRLEGRLAEQRGAGAGVVQVRGGARGRGGAGRATRWATTRGVRTYCPVTIVERAGMHTTFWLWARR